MQSFHVRLLAGIALLTSGCATGGMIGSSVDSVSAAPEPAAGPRPTVAVASFDVAAPKAQQEVGNSLRDMLTLALLRTQCCQVLEAEEDGSSSADYLVTGALTEFEPSAGGVGASDYGSGVFAGIMQDVGLQHASADAAHVGIDIRLVAQSTREIRNATLVRGVAVDVESLQFSDDSLGSGLEVYSNTPMEAAVRDAIEKGRCLDRRERGADRLSHPVTFGPGGDWLRPAGSHRRPR